MVNPADVSDVVARFRPLTSAETTVAQTRLGDAWAMIKSQRPTIEADIAATRVDQDIVIRVIAEMVIRVLRNPDGFSEETIDDYRYKRDSVVSTGTLYLSAEELAALVPVPTQPTGRRNSVRLVNYGDR